MKITLRILLFLACAAFARGATFELGVHGTLSVTVPETWVARGRDLGGKAFDLTFQPKSDANAQCKLTLIYPDKPMAIDKERIKKDIQGAAQKFVAGSVEKKAVLKEFKLKRGYGAYCSFTDESLVGKPPIRGNYKTMTSGFVGLSEDVTGAVTLLSDSFASQEFKTMLSIVESLEIRRSDSKKL
ncbi:MAG: hypothetical protein HW412_2509 [Bacteroidetes bacterium]|nr:hypothetical protein [Bacteroidota bacterium]